MRITLDIPDNKYQFFLELIRNLGFDKPIELDIPEEQQAIVRERIQKSEQNPDRLLDWEQVQDNFKLD